ncbi:MAG TPA: SusC/RagA family TonB-linked outer membrane protein [Mucilaginibacter sp.]|nr:SusC/RagA family TonB-linked outer membrane protein [Mucilaginibacter sp.]
MRKICLLFSVFLLLGNVLMAQNRTITGTVTDEKNEPLPGAVVHIKGSQASTATDANGRYSIKVTNLQNVVVGVTFIGYNYQEKTLRVGEQNADFKMVPSNNGLSEVVVVGYGEQKKATLTGSVATIDVKKVEDLPSLSLASSLVGQVPGLSINTASERPGQPVTTTIRNPITYSKNGQGGNTLYVIDDVVRTVQDFNLLDPSQIESISVLKDAEAAIYGIDGGNGVIVVRTKKGKQGAPKISFSTSFGTENARQLPKMMSGIQLATWLNDYYQVQAGQTPGNYIDPNGYLNGDVTKKQSQWYTPDELAYFANPANNTNWLAQAFKPADVERGALTVSGGSDKVTYFISSDYVNQNSNFAGVNSHKMGFMANVEAKPAKGLTASLSLSDNISYNRSFWYKTAGTSESLDEDVTSLVRVAPWSKYFIDGNPVLLNSNHNGATNIDNVNVFLFENSNNYTGGTSYIMNVLAKLNYEIPGVKGLSVGASYNDNIDNQFNKQYGTAFDYYRYSGLGDNNHIPGGTIVGSPILIKNGDRVRLTPNYTTDYQFDADINYKRSFGKHNINFIGIYEQTESYMEGVAAEADGVIPTGLDNQNFTTGQQSSSQASNISELGKLSYIARLNYDYAGKYLVQMAFRRDGSVDLAPDRQYANFPSASIGWVASEEPFIKNNFNFIDLLKFRASVGEIGSDNTPAYEYATYYKYGTGSGGGAVFNEGEKGLGIQYNMIPNPYITWDHQTKTDYGVDMAFLKNRLSVTADYYWNHNYDMLTGLSASVPFTIGGTVPNENFGAVNTFGYEVSVTWRDQINNSWSYNVTPFFTWSDDKVLKYDVPSGLIGTFRDRTGKSDDGGVLGYKYTGMFRTQAQVDAFMGAHPGYTIFGQTPEPGMLNYQDLNGDGKIDDNDIQYLSHKAGNHNMAGFNFGFTYKSVSLNVTTGLSWGGQGVISGADITQSVSKDITENKPAFWADHWTPANPNAKYPAPYYYQYYNADYPSNFWFVSSFSWDIQNVNLSYTLPERWTKVIGVSSARIYAVCTNALSLFNPYPDHFRDPNTDINQYPELRSISFGLNVGF